MYPKWCISLYVTTSDEFVVSVRNVLEKVRAASLRETCIVPIVHVDLFDRYVADILVTALSSYISQDTSARFDVIRICDTSIWPDLSGSFDLV